MLKKLSAPHKFYLLAYFTIHGGINQHWCIKWGPENPHETFQKLSVSPAQSSFFNFSGYHLFGPYFINKARFL